MLSKIEFRNIGSSLILINTNFIEIKPANYKASTSRLTGYKIENKINNLFQESYLKMENSRVPIL